MSYSNRKVYEFRSQEIYTSRREKLIENDQKPRSARHKIPLWDIAMGYRTAAAPCSHLVSGPALVLRNPVTYFTVIKQDFWFIHLVPMIWYPPTQSQFIAPTVII